MIMAYVLFKVYYSALPAIKNLPASAGNMGSIPGEGTKMPRVSGQLSPHAMTESPHSTDKDPAQTKKRERHQSACEVIS